MCNGFVCSQCHPIQCDCCIAIQCKQQHMAYLVVSSLVHVIHIYTAVNDGDCSGKQTEFRPGVRRVVHVSACNVLRTRKPVFSSPQPASQGSLSGSLPQAQRSPQTDHPPSQRSETDRQSKGPCPSSFRGPLGLSSSGDSTRHQPVLPALGTLSPASLLPATTLRLLCAYLTTDPFCHLRNSVLLFDSSRRPSNTHHHLTLGPAATPLRNHESRVVSTPFTAVALFMRCRCMYYTKNEHH